MYDGFVGTRVKRRIKHVVTISPIDFLRLLNGQPTTKIEQQELLGTRNGDIVRAMMFGDSRRWTLAYVIRGHCTGPRLSRQKPRRT